MRAVDTGIERAALRAVLEQPCNGSRQVVTALGESVCRLLGVKAHADELVDASAASAAATSLGALSAKRGTQP